MKERAPEQFVLAPEAEARCRAQLHDYLSSVGASNLEKNVNELMALEGGFVDRFRYVQEHERVGQQRRLLVSGCAVGSEMLVARQFGYHKICGTEVVPRYVELTTERLRGLTEFEVQLYNGKQLPWPDASFTAVISAHIIEHTPEPEVYLHEHLRVLAPGGILFLEFPDRYHLRELHTGLPSVEWLPKPAREIALRLLAACPLLSTRTRALYQEVRTTLQPISIWQIRAWIISSHGARARLVHAYHPAPGYTRCIVEK